MALQERLQILVTADGKGAAREFQRVGATADREIGKADDRIRKLGAGLTSFGTQLGLAGGVATAGMFQLAKAAGEYGEQVSAAEVIFGDASESIEEFGKEAIKSSGLSRRAAVEASNTFGTFGKAAGLAGEDLATFSVDLTTLAGDLASFKDTSTEEAITALGAALRGESEPLRRYGVLLDDATLKQRAMELGIYNGNGALNAQQKILAAQAEIFEQTTDAQGDYLRTSDSLTNQTRSFSAEMENLQIALGEGAVPVFSELIGMANGALSSFQNLSPETQNLVGKLGAIGAIGATGVGGLAFLVGQGLRAVDTFRDLSGRFRDADGNLTRLGRTAKTTGKLLGGAGLAFAAYEVARALNDATQDTVQFDTALNRLTVADSSREVLEQFDEMLSSVEGVGDRLRDTFSGETLGVVELDGFRIEVDNLNEALSTLRDQDPDQLRKVLEAFDAGDIEVLEPGRGVDALDATRDILADYRENLDSASDAEARMNREAAAADPSVQALTGALEDSADGAEQARSAWESYADAVKASTDPFFGVIDANESLAEAQLKVAEAQASGNPEEVTEAHYAAVKAAQSQELALLNLRGAIEAGDVSLEDARATLDRWTASGAITQEQANLVALAIAGVDQQARSVPDEIDIQVRVQGVRAAIDQINQLRKQGQIGFFQAGVGRIVAAGNAATGGRATGGDVYEGGTWTVNERGQEMFSPRTNGFVMNADKTNQLLEGVGKIISGDSPQRGGNTYNFNMPVQSQPDGPTIVRGIRAAEWLHEGAV